jgi:hypothetical protein
VGLPGDSTYISQATPTLHLPFSPSFVIRKRSSFAKLIIKMRNICKSNYFLLALVVALCVTTSGKAQEIVKQQASETLKDFALRIIPAKAELAYEVVQGIFATSTKNLVILYSTPEAQGSAFSGWVLMPVTNGTYQKFTLPIEADLSGRFEITAQSVFFANADKDTQQELFIIYSTYRNGSGEKEGNAVHVFNWNGKEFVSLTEVENKLSGLPTAKAVRRKLKILGY